MNHTNDKSLESWIWDAACSIRGAQEAPKFKDFILPLIFTKRLCDVFDDELNRIALEVGSRAKALKLVEKDHTLVRFSLPLRPQDPDESIWSVIRKLTGRIGESLTTYLHDIAKANPALEGIIDRMDFNATTHGQRDIDDDRLSDLIERVSEKRLGLKDVEADIIGRSYEYLIRKVRRGKRSISRRILHASGGWPDHGLNHGSGAGDDRLRSVLRLGGPAHRLRKRARRKDETAQQKKVCTAEDARAGVRCHHVGYGQHEHDHS